MLAMKIMIPNQPLNPISDTNTNLNHYILVHFGYWQL